MSIIKDKLQHLDIEINYDKLLQEFHQMEFKNNKSENWWRAKTEERRQFWKNSKAWQKAVPLEIYPPETQRLKELFNADVVLHYILRSDYELPRHRDWEVITAVNIILSEDNAPITFGDDEDIYYKCALVDISQDHSVKPYPNDRYLLKYCWKDRTFEEIREEFYDRKFIQRCK